MNPPSTPDYPFTPAELARLARYRAAVKAGLYTDHGPKTGLATAPVLACAPPERQNEER